MSASPSRSRTSGAGRQPPGAPSRRIAELEAAGVAVFLAVAIGLRFVRLDLGWFGVDQARDIAIGLDVAAGRAWPAVGPTMRRVARLGALYHYFWALPFLGWRDPMAAYYFAASLSLAGVLITWRLARRVWGRLAGLVALGVSAAHPVWAIDGRVAWAPAALPAAAALALALALPEDRYGPRVATSTAGRGLLPALRRSLALRGRPLRESLAGGGALSPARAACLGAVLGIAVQLHLTMAAWSLAGALVVLLDRPARPVLAAGIAGAALTGWPALWALIADTGDAGLASLGHRGPAPPLAARLGAIFALPWRVPSALSAWPDVDPTGGALVVGAAALTSVATVAGLARLGWHGVRGDRPARVVVIAAAVTTAMVVGLPGEAWYYYLDSLLPVWALGAGALVARAPLTRPRAAAGPLTVAAATARDAGDTCDGGDQRGAPRSVRVVLAAMVLAAALVLAAHLASWIGRLARDGYLPVEPSGLALGGRGGADAAVPGRLVAVGVKRAVAALAVEDAAPLAESWRRLHGPAFNDVTGDNGFWLAWQAGAHASAGGGAPSGTRRHVGLWYRDTPVGTALAARAGTSDVAVDAVGPLVVVRYAPVLDYETCRAEGQPVSVPVRIVPDPRRYGDGTPARPRALPERLRCRLAPTAATTRVVAALDGPGAIHVADLARGAAMSGSGEAAICVPGRAGPGSVEVATTLDPGAASDLDLYEIPFGIGCAP